MSGVYETWLAFLRTGQRTTEDAQRAIEVYQGLGREEGKEVQEAIKDFQSRQQTSSPTQNV